MSDAKTYTCACCKGVFESGWTDEEAKAEAVKNIPDWDQADKETVCDSCYAEIMAQQAYANHMTK